MGEEQEDLATPHIIIRETDLGMSEALGGLSPSAPLSSSTALCCTPELCASRAQAQPSRMAEVSWPATSMVISSSRRDWSSIPGGRMCGEAQSKGWDRLGRGGRGIEEVQGC
jgi:hypothetical protein